MCRKDIRAREELDVLMDNLANVPLTFENATDFRHQTKDGSILQVEIVSHAIPFEGRSARLVIANDITEKKELEAQLRQSQKLEGIGQLAGGIAHDFNNLLTVIVGYSDLLLRGGQLDEATSEKIEEIKGAAERASSLTRQLLAFSRKQVLKTEILNL